MTWVLHKFGGTSLANEVCYRKVASIIQEVDSQRIAIISSAVGGITDILQDALDHAKQGDEFTTLLEKIQSKHTTIAQKLLLKERYEGYMDFFRSKMSDLQDLLRSVEITAAYSELMRDCVLGFGELWSTNLLTEYLKEVGEEAEFIDARDVLIVEDLGATVAVEWEQSQELMDSKIGNIQSRIIVITGFIAKNGDGIATTLKRNGSDLSASIFGVLLKASEITIWTDVNGVYSADPNRVPEAVVLPRISYLEVLELAYFGAKILHPGIIAPAMKHGIPILVRNTFNPSAEGTIIGANGDDNGQLVKGFATIDKIALLNVEGSGMIGVPGISQTLFAALREKSISVIMISQASSEYSICIAVQEKDGNAALKALQRTFATEMHTGMIQNITLEMDCGILAAVGDRMVDQPGIAAMVFTALARARINVRSISQGSSERNISVVLDRQDLTRGLRAVHSAFTLSHLTLSVGIIGIGLIGSSLLDQMKTQYNHLRDKLNIDLRIRALANSKSMLLQKNIALDKWRSEFKNKSMKLDLQEFVEQVNSASFPHAVIIDCSASQDVADQYIDWLDAGIHVITPNKKASSASLEYHDELQRFINKGPSTNPLDKSTYYFYETTVGAGLPVISTLKDLIKTGDRIICIDGILSGTISYLFNELNEKNSFSDIVKDAKQKGYTEPDPRDDLSGIDFARKLVILAREAGYKVSLDDVVIQNIISAELFEAKDVETFLEQLPGVDDYMRKKVSEAGKRGQVLRYVGTIEDGRCRLALSFYPKSHPFANLHGGENIVLFKTERYHGYPLIVQGPGAGAAVTSAGVFADLLRLADLLGNA